jgi:hypothetical protein
LTMFDLQQETRELESIGLQLRIGGLAPA